MSGDYGYANARLRAMKSRLLTPDQYRRLLGQERVESFISLLATTDYQDDVESALLHATGVSCVADALRRNVARLFGRVVDFFAAGEPQSLMRILLSRWDLHNVLTVVRGQANRIPAAEILAALTPVGALGWGELETLAQQSGVVAVVDVMLTRRLPYANALARTLAQNVGIGELKQIEYALMCSHYQQICDALSRPSANAQVVYDLVQAEIDNLNLVLFMRLWSDPGSPLGMDASWSQWRIPGGSLREEQWQILFHAPGPEQILAALPSTELRRILAPVLGVSPPAVARVLERSLAHRAMRLWTAGDPLGIGLGAAYIWAKVSEAANLRLLAHAVAGDLDRSRIWEDLILWPNSS